MMCEEKLFRVRFYFPSFQFLVSVLGFCLVILHFVDMLPCWKNLFIRRGEQLTCHTAEQEALGASESLGASEALGARVPLVMRNTD